MGIRLTFGDVHGQLQLGSLLCLLFLLFILSTAVKKIASEVNVRNKLKKDENTTYIQGCLKRSKIMN